MQNIKAVLCDIDGTILDTRESIIKATEHALSSHGYPVPDRAVIASHVGKSFDDFYLDLCGATDPTSLIASHREFQHANMHLSILFPHALETLQKLRAQGLKLAA